MNIEERHFLGQLIAADWIDVFAMPIQNHRSVLLDIVFVTSDAGIRLLGKAHILPHQDEAFSLMIDSHVRNGWWKEPGIGISEEWVPRYISAELRQESNTDIMYSPRWVKFYSSNDLQKRVHRDGAILDDCTAIEFGVNNADGVQRIGVAASNRYPCAVEYAATEIEVNSLLKDFYPIEISSIGETNGD